MFGFFPTLKDCSEDLRADIQYFDISVTQGQIIHIKNNVVPRSTFKITDGGTLTITNCLIRVKKVNEDEQEVILPEQTFFIIRDKQK